MTSVSPFAGRKNEAPQSNPASLDAPQSTDRRMSAWADKYRGATVEDLDPPSALSLSPHDTISHALLCAFERDYTHLTVVDPENRSLLGYLSIPRLKSLLQSKAVSENDTVEKAMQKFKRSKGHVYKVITMDTPLEELESFFNGGADGVRGEKQEFAVVTDGGRRFVLGVATRADLEEFAASSEATSDAWWLYAKGLTKQMFCGRKAHDLVGSDPSIWFDR